MGKLSVFKQNKKDIKMGALGRVDYRRCEGIRGGASCGTGRKHPRHGEVVVAEVGSDTILGAWK